METLLVNDKTVKIKVPNGSAFAYDTPEHLPKAHMISLAVAPRGGGKSVAISNLMKHIQFDRVFVISPTFHSNSSLMSMLPIDDSDVYENTDDPSIVDKIIKKVEEERDDLYKYQQDMKEYNKFMKNLHRGAHLEEESLFRFYRNGYFPKPEHKWGGRRPFMAVLCDDVQGSKLMTSRKIDNLVIKHRHIGSFPDDQPSLGVSIFFLIQNYSSKAGGISRAIRNNATNMLIFKCKDEKQLDQISSEVSGEVDKETFMKVYEKATDEPHSFLFIDLFPKPNHPSQFRKRFDQFLIPTNINVSQ
jgi:hypothetical protein